MDWLQTSGLPVPDDIGVCPPPCPGQLPADKAGEKRGEDHSTMGKEEHKQGLFGSPGVSVRLEPSTTGGSRECVFLSELVPEVNFLHCVSVIMGGRIGRREGRKESKNLCFILGSRTPESLFVYVVPAPLCLVCPAPALCLGHSKPLLLLEGELCSTPLPHSVYSCYRLHELLHRPSPGITGQ